MSDENPQDNAAKEVVPPEEIKANVEQEKVERPTETAQARNFAELRRQKEELQKTLEYQQQVIEEMRNAKKVPEPVDELESIGDEEYIPKGKVKKIAMKEAQRIAKEEMTRMVQEQHKASFKDRLKSKYSDFDDVVNNETLALLQEQDPELANTIGENQDPYKMGMTAYKYIKALGIVEKVPGSRRVKEVDKKIEENKTFVQSPQTYDKRPLAQAFRMTKEEKNKLYEEMMQYASMASSVPELH